MRTSAGRFSHVSLHAVVLPDGGGLSVRRIPENLDALAAVALFAASMFSMASGLPAAAAASGLYLLADGCRLVWGDPRRNEAPLPGANGGVCRGHGRRGDRHALWLPTTRASSATGRTLERSVCRSLLEPCGAGLRRGTNILAFRLDLPDVDPRRDGTVPEFSVASARWQFGYAGDIDRRAGDPRLGLAGSSRFWTGAGQDLAVRRICRIVASSGRCRLATELGKHANRCAIGNARLVDRRHSGISRRLELHRLPSTPRPSPPRRGDAATLPGRSSFVLPRRIHAPWGPRRLEVAERAGVPFRRRISPPTPASWHELACVPGGNASVSAGTLLAGDPGQSPLVEFVGSRADAADPRRIRPGKCSFIVLSGPAGERVLPCAQGIRRDVSDLVHDDGKLYAGVWAGIAVDELPAGEYRVVLPPCATTASNTLNTFWRRAYPCRPTSRDRRQASHPAPADDAHAPRSSRRGA